jgi:hypothetical protein
MSIARYLQFLDPSNEAHYGEVSDDLLASGTLEGKEVPVLTGQPLEGFTRSGGKAIIQKVVAPSRLGEHDTNLMTRCFVQSNLHLLSFVLDSTTIRTPLRPT